MTQLRVRSEASGEGGRHPVSDRPSPPLIRIVGLGKRFSSRSGEVVTALSDVNLDIRDNEFISIVGPSGCGKTTLPAYPGPVSKTHLRARFIAAERS